MSFGNPSPLKIGMVGTLSGVRYRVAGRVVVGMEEEGETYYWNEFNLQSEEGDSATLVFESDEQGRHWRLFTLFEPETPITAGEAAHRRVGDRLKLEGTNVRVTLVDESRVYHIEGEAPEGVELGDVARYFNAEGGGETFVVSWTGDEVECYRGWNLPYAAVRSAFNLGSGTVDEFEGVRRLQESRAASRWWISAAANFLVLIIGIGVFFSCRAHRQSPALARMRPPSVALKLGSAARLQGATWQLRAHSVVEVAEVGRRYEQHEYQLVGEGGRNALLIYGFKPGTKSWHLFTPVQPASPLAPQQAAALRVGDRLNFDSAEAPVRNLYQYTVRQTETAETPETKSGTVLYGVTAQTNSTLLLARWSDSGIACFRGELLAAKEVAAAFGRK